MVTNAPLILKPRRRKADMDEDLPSMLPSPLLPQPLSPMGS